MRYLLDASALVPLVTRRGSRLLSDLSAEEFLTTDLALYEACNALWKLVVLQRTMEFSDALEVSAALGDLASTRMIKRVSFEALHPPEALGMACQEKLTFYDSSYVAAAKGTESVLVTEDDRLAGAAMRHVRTMSYMDLEQSLGKAPDVRDARV